MAESGAATGQQQRPISTRAIVESALWSKTANMSNTEYHIIFLYHKISVFNKTEKHQPGQKLLCNSIVAFLGSVALTRHQLGPFGTGTCTEPCAALFLRR